MLTISVCAPDRAPFVIPDPVAERLAALDALSTSRSPAALDAFGEALCSQEWRIRDRAWSWLQPQLPDDLTAGRSLFRFRSASQSLREVVVCRGVDRDYRFTEYRVYEGDCIVGGGAVGIIACR